MVVSLFLYGLVVLALLITELREGRRSQYVFKPLAAFGFIIMALQFGALESTYGKYILGGLVACAIGDLLLLSRKSDRIFKAGMAAFALGHLAYIAALSTNHYPYLDLALFRYIFIVLAALSSACFFVWLKPKLDKEDVFAVLIYTIIITLMVAASIARLNVSWQLLAPIAALMFAISDMFVARDRFVKPDPKNALAITPLYFGAQALFALSTQTLGA